MNQYPAYNSRLPLKGSSQDSCDIGKVPLTLRVLAFSQPPITDIHNMMQPKYSLRKCWQMVMSYNRFNLLLNPCLCLWMKDHGSDKSADCSQCSINRCHTSKREPRWNIFHWELH